MGPVAISFGLGGAAVYVIAALFSTRHNRNVAAFAVLMWAATKVWNYPTGSDAQIYIDAVLALLCGLLCVAVMFRDRRSRWPLVVLTLMVCWEFLNAFYSEPGRHYGADVQYAYQLACNVLFGMTLLVLAAPGAGHGALVIFRRMRPGFVRRPRHPLGVGWGRDAPEAFSKRWISGR